MKWLISFLIAYTGPCLGQSFIQFYDQGPSDNFRRMRATDDGGYILCGSQGGSPTQAWVLKVDANGGEEWSQLLIGAGEAFDIQEMAGGGYILTGGKANSGESDSLSIWRLDASGEMIWQKRHVPVQPRNLGRSIIPLSSGGSIICGRTGLGGFIHDLLVMKVDDTGEMEWHKEFDLGGLDEAIQILEHPDGGYVVLATTSADGAYHEPLLMRTDQDGDSLWTIPIAGAGIDIAHQMILTSAPGILTVGRTTTTFGEPGDIWLDHRDLLGEPIWSNSIGLPWVDETGYDVVELQEGGYVIAVEAGTAGWMKIDAQGELITEAGAEIGPVRNIVGLVDLLGVSYVIAGNVITDTTYTGYHTDGFLLRTDPDGVMSIDRPLFHSTSIHPNPASDVLYINADLDGPMGLEMIDGIGRKIMDLTVVPQHGIDLTRLRPGLYTLIFKTGEGVIGSHRLMIQR